MPPVSIVWWLLLNTHSLSNEMPYPKETPTNLSNPSHLWTKWYYLSLPSPLSSCCYWMLTWSSQIRQTQYDRFFPAFYELLSFVNAPWVDSRWQVQIDRSYPGRKGRSCSGLFLTCACSSYFQLVFSSIYIFCFSPSNSQLSSSVVSC